MDDFLRACHDAVKDADAKRLASTMGLPHVSLLQRANPDNDAHKLTINHLFQILLHSGDMRPLQALAEEFGFDLVAKDQAKPQQIEKAVLGMCKAAAVVTSTATEAMDDGHVSQIEKQSIKRAIAKARESLDVLEQSVKVA